MKPHLYLLFFCSFLFFKPSIAQDIRDISFKYWCVPTSTSDYSIAITKDKFVLNKTEKIPDKKDRIRKVASSNYTHSFDSKEKEIINNIIEVNKLDSIGLYQERKTEWGTQWEIKIERNSITYDISLPNYNNVGLESLIHFIVCLIPKGKRPLFECKKCN